MATKQTYWMQLIIFGIFSDRIYRVIGYTGLFKMIIGVIHDTLEVQPHVISFYGVTSGIRFMFLLFPQVFWN